MPIPSPAEPRPTRPSPEPPGRARRDEEGRRDKAHGDRAVAITTARRWRLRRGVRTMLLVGGSVWALVACTPDPAAVVPARAAERQQIDELVEALTPLPADLTSNLLDRHLHRGRELLDKARSGGREVGLAALQRLREGAPKGEDGLPIQDVERGLLQVAAHAAPDDARPLLENLVLQYGAGLHLRTEALICLAETSPARAVEILEPMVTKARPSQTMPPAEFIVRAWVTACEKTGRSPVKELVDVATNLFYDQTGRTAAVKLLRSYSDPLAVQALTAILVESTGDGYLRRMAAQGLRDVLPREEACSIFRKVADREADLNMLKFLLDVIEKNCGL